MNNIYFLYILLICISLLSIDSMLLYNSKLSRLSLLSATSIQLPIQIPIESNEIKQKRPRNRAILTYISSSSANVTLPLNLPIDISTLQSYIIYEDNDLIVLDKPSTLLSQPEKETITIKNKKVDNNIVSDNIYDATLRYLEEKLKFNNNENENDNNNNNNNNNDTNNENNDIYLALINRLDRPCSGVMVMCKNKKSAGKLSEALKERTLSNDNIETNLEVKEEKFKKIDKQYFAILNNHINEAAINETITLSNMISKSTTSKVKIFENDNTNTTTTKKSKNLVKATLQYKLLKNFFAGTKKGEVQGESSGNPQSLVQIYLQSGRKHQIRAQFGHINHPIIGDLKYSANQQFKEKDIALHSYLISLKHPGTGKKMKFISKVPVSWNKRFGQHIVDECNNVIHNITISDDIKYI